VEINSGCEGIVSHDTRLIPDVFDSGRLTGGSRCTIGLACLAAVDGGETSQAAGAGATCACRADPFSPAAIHDSTATSAVM
jgi:hypothetical protein